MPALVSKRILPAKTWSEQQNGRWCFDALWDIGGRRVKVSIRIDSYDMQSHAHAEIFDPSANRWNRVADIPYPKMASLGKAYAKVVPSAQFALDEATLLDEVRALL